MHDIDWNTVKLFAAIELISVVIFGLLSASAVWLRYRFFPNSSQVFRYGGYTLPTTGNFRNVSFVVPKWYYFVIVKHHPNNQVINETFYGITGDITQLIYSEDASPKAAGYYLSTVVLALPSLIGFGLVFIANFLSLPISSLIIGDQSEIIRSAVRVGVTLFVPFFISAPIKILFDLILYEQFSNPNPNSQ